MSVEEKRVKAVIKASKNFLKEAIPAALQKEKGKTITPRTRR